MYIRTKDGVYEVVQSNDIYTEVKGNTNGVPLNNGNTAIHFTEILKQSEKLEELCDEFVGYVGEEYVKENETYDMPNFQEYNLKDMLYHMSYNKEDCVVYGAVWTSKGLIFVAKMNDKGDLELI